MKDNWIALVENKSGRNADQDEKTEWGVIQREVVIEVRAIWLLERKASP